MPRGDKNIFIDIESVVEAMCKETLDNIMSKMGDSNTAINKWLRFVNYPQDNKWKTICAEFGVNEELIEALDVFDLCCKLMITSDIEISANEKKILFLLFLGRHKSLFIVKEDESILYKYLSEKFKAKNSRNKISKKEFNYLPGRVVSAEQIVECGQGFKTQKVVETMKSLESKGYIKVVEYKNTEFYKLNYEGIKEISKKLI